MEPAFIYIQYKLWFAKYAAKVMREDRRRDG
jgi:hypothetical protein